MHDSHDGDQARPSSPRTPEGLSSSGSLARLEQLGDLHYESASYSAAADYFRAALATDDPKASVDFREPLRLHRKLSDCLRRQELLAEAEAELDTCLRLLENPTADEAERARIHVRRAQVLFARGQYDEASRLARVAFSLLAATEHHLEVGMAQMTLGNCHVRLGLPAKAEEFYQDALSTYRRIDQRRSQIQVLLNLGVLAKNACRWSRALTLFERAEDLCRESGATFEYALLYLNRAILYRKMGRRAEALANAERGLKVSEALGDQGRITKYRLLLGQLLIDDGKLVEAERHLLEARVQAEQRGALREQALADEFLGDLMARRGRPEEADANYLTAEERARQISQANDILAEVLRRRATLALESNPDQAETLARRGLEVAERCGEEFERPYLRRTLAAALREKGELAEACLELQAALSGFRATRLPGEMATTLEALADLHEEMGGREHLLLARAQVQEALALDLDAARLSPCALQLRLAHLELQLGNCDEALLALFELERLSCGAEVDVLAEIESLRGEIERRMGSQARQVCDQVQRLAELPELLVDEEFPASVGFGSVLQSIAERLGAERAFAAFVRGPQPELIAAWQCAPDTARKLAPHAAEVLCKEAILRGPRIFSRTDDDPIWRHAELGAHAPRRTAVAFGIESDAAIVGLVYLDSGSERGLSFDTESLAMASTYIHLVQGTLLDEMRARDQRRRAVPAEPAFEHVLTTSEKVLDVLRLCSKVAPSPYTVLLTGETGVGKGLLARTLHELSPRRDRPMVSVNCAAIPETLLESELFGHIKGSFTGADRDRIGLIETAAGGTLFLDEIGKMSLPMQAKLLHFLDTKELRPVGGSTTRRIDVRVICATKRDLKRMVHNDEFLEDLYYRLLDFPIEVPPLRERGEDVLLLARHYVEASALELGRETPHMTRNFAQRLADYAWPGNVRELEKVIKRAVILAADEDRLREQHLPSEFLQGRRGATSDEIASEVRPLREQIAQLERNVLQSALERSAWNRSQVARELRMSYPTLLQKIRLYDLNPLA